MHLWNEYEGRIVADQFPLTKLLEPEGRSAFFSTTNGSGAPAVIRLIEAHFDEPEILSRWSAVSKIDQPNLIKLKKFGQTTLDETALLYAVMEPTDAQPRRHPQRARRSPAKETHADRHQPRPRARGAAREQPHPRAHRTGQRSRRRRSRQAAQRLHPRSPPEGCDANEFKARDVHDLAVVLLQSLTLQRKLAPGTNLPAPFQRDRRQRHQRSLGPRRDRHALGVTATPSAAAAPAAPKPQPAPAAIKPEPAIAAVDCARTAASTPHRRAHNLRRRARRITPWTTIAAALILALFIGWHFLHKSPPPIPTLATMPASAAGAAAAPAEQPLRLLQPQRIAPASRRTHPVARRRLHLQPSKIRPRSKVAADREQTRLSQSGSLCAQRTCALSCHRRRTS